MRLCWAELGDCLQRCGQGCGKPTTAVETSMHNNHRRTLNSPGTGVGGGRQWEGRPGPRKSWDWSHRRRLGTGVVLPTRGLRVMLKTWSLRAGAKSNIWDRDLGEVEKNSFIALPSKGGHSGLVPWKTVCPNLGGFGEEFYSNGSRAGLLTRLHVCRACTPLIWPQGVSR